MVHVSSIRLQHSVVEALTAENVFTSSIHKACPPKAGTEPSSPRTAVVWMHLRIYCWVGIRQFSLLMHLPLITRRPSQFLPLHSPSVARRPDPEHVRHIHKTLGLRIQMRIATH